MESTKHAIESLYDEIMFHMLELRRCLRDSGNYTLVAKYKISQNMCGPTNRRRKAIIIPCVSGQQDTPSNSRC